jgi:hypothetical protein
MLSLANNIRLDQMTELQGQTDPRHTDSCHARLITLPNSTQPRPKVNNCIVFYYAEVNLVGIWN